MWNWLEIFKICLDNVWWLIILLFPAMCRIGLLHCWVAAPTVVVQSNYGSVKFCCSRHIKASVPDKKPQFQFLTLLILFCSKFMIVIAWWSLDCRYDISLKLYLQMSCSILSFEEFWLHRGLSHKRSILKEHVSCNHNLWAQHFCNL